MYNTSFSESTTNFIKRLRGNSKAQGSTGALWALWAIEMKKTAMIFLFCTLFCGCTPGILECCLTFDEINKTYEFAFSKQELKRRIVDAYTYHTSLLLLNLGKTTIENAAINAEYRKSTEMWLDRSNWERFESEISDKTTDTLTIIIGHHHSRKAIEMIVVVSGNENKSFLTLQRFKYTRTRKCLKEKDYYRFKLTDQIQRKFIDKLK